MFGWNIFVTKLILGGLLGYYSVNSRLSLKVPSYQMVSLGPIMMAVHFMMLFYSGLAMISVSLSACIFWKSRMSRFVAFVAMLPNYYRRAGAFAHFKHNGFTDKNS